MMVYRTADDVAEMEQENHELRIRLEQTSRNLEIVSAECNRLRVENTLMEAKSRDMLIKTTRTEQVLSGVAQMIVSSLKEFQMEREQARAVRRQEQEAALEATIEEPPKFLRRPAPDIPPHPEPTPPRPQRSIGMTEQEGMTARAEQLRGAADRIARRSPFVPVLDNALAARDPRLPQNDFIRPEDEDENNLREIADNMGRRA